MVVQDKDLRREFDETVKSYNKWLTAVSRQNPWSLSRFRWCLRGMKHMFDFYNGPTLDKIMIICGHPVYDRADLTENQKDAILIASDWVRTGIVLDKIIAGEDLGFDFPVKDAKEGRNLVQNMYLSYWGIYASEAAKRR